MFFEARLQSSRYLHVRNSNRGWALPCRGAPASEYLAMDSRIYVQSNDRFSVQPLCHFSCLLVLPRNLEQGRAWAHDAGKVRQGHEHGEQRYGECDGLAGATDQLTQGHFDDIFCGT